MPWVFYYGMPDIFCVQLSYPIQEVPTLYHCSEPAIRSCLCQVTFKHMSVWILVALAGF